jgi:phosphocarrier protein
MASKTVKVGSSIGLHARPATLIAQAATEAGQPVTIGPPSGPPVDAGSALLIMTLGAKFGDEVEVTSDDDATLEKIAGLVEQDLDA